MIKTGRYLHYKGGVYIVLFTAMCSETKEPVVVYMHELHGSYYTRSLKEFTEDVNGLPRFTTIETTPS